MERRYQERLEEAMDVADDGKLRKALKLFESLITDFPAEMQPRFERAMVYLDIDNEKAAISDLEHVLQFEPDYPGARNWFAIVSAGQGKALLAAETSLTDLMSKAPEHWSANGQAWADCARYFLDAGDPSRALAVLDV